VKIVVKPFPEHPFKEQEIQWPRLQGSLSNLVMWHDARPAAIPNVPPNWNLPNLLWMLLVTKEQHPSAEQNHSLSCIWSGRTFQLRLDLHLPKTSNSAEVKKYLRSKTLSLFLASARKPPILQKPTQKEESSFGEGRGSPKGN